MWRELVASSRIAKVVLWRAKFHAPASHLDSKRNAESRQGTPGWGSRSISFINETKGCPLKKRRAATTANKTYGFVDASPSRVLRDREGMFRSKLTKYCRLLFAEKISFRGAGDQS